MGEAAQKVLSNFFKSWGEEWAQPTSSVTLRVPPVSLRLGHRTALALLTQFTTVLPLRYPVGKAMG